MSLGGMLGGLASNLVGLDGTMAKLEELGIDASIIEGLALESITGMLSEKGIALSIPEGLGISVEDIVAKIKGRRLIAWGENHPHLPLLEMALSPTIYWEVSLQEADEIYVENHITATDVLGRLAKLQLLAGLEILPVDRYYERVQLEKTLWVDVCNYPSGYRTMISVSGPEQVVLALMRSLTDLAKVLQSRVSAFPRVDLTSVGFDELFVYDPDGKTFIGLFMEDAEEVLDITNLRAVDLSKAWPA